MRPRVFVSSTIDDLKYLRDHIRNAIEDLSYEPVMSEYNDIGYMGAARATDSCYRAVVDCQLYVLIVAKRAGHIEPDDMSVTHKEFKAAGIHHVPRITFVEQNVFECKKFYDANKTSTPLTVLPGIDDPVHVFALLDDVMSSDHDNGIVPFSSADELCSKLKQQFARLMWSMLKKPRGCNLDLSAEPLQIQAPIDALGNQSACVIVREKGARIVKCPHPADLALANLVGSWNENCEADCQLIAKLARAEYGQWIRRIQEVDVWNNQLVSVRNGVWSTHERVKLWEDLGAHIFDTDIGLFREIACTVLSECDPRLDLPREHRHAADLYGKARKYSSEIRSGIADGLAILASNHHRFTKCTTLRLPDTVSSIVSGLLYEGDWIKWASINDLAPALAEAAPDTFLAAVDCALKKVPCPFDELFAQEGHILVGGCSYMTGILWALESLAWEEERLVRVCVLLAKLAQRDPGGQWANRPDQSLTTILLPWHPQTLAPTQRKTVAVRTLCEQTPRIAWNLILTLLPNETAASCGTYRPRWRNSIPVDWGNKVSNADYRQQVSDYSALAVEMARKDSSRLAEIIDHLNNLPQMAFDEIVRLLSSDGIVSLPDTERRHVWERLRIFIARHKQHSQCDWALGAAVLADLERTAEHIMPTRSIDRHHHLFTGKVFDLYEETGKWEEQEKRLALRRAEAVREILNEGGLFLVVQFAASVADALMLGNVLGSLPDCDFDAMLLHANLNTENTSLAELVTGYVWGRLATLGWDWIDHLDRSSWEVPHIVTFLTKLPFRQKTWERASLWLPGNECEYWRRTTANAYQMDGNVNYAVDALMQHNRPRAAFTCLARNLYLKKEVDPARCLNALLFAAKSSEDVGAFDRHDIVEAIKCLQNMGETVVDQDKLTQVEWLYLSLLEHGREVTPKTLESSLAKDPLFFCEVIGRAYRSEKQGNNIDESADSAPDVVQHSWHLLRKWSIVPGMINSGEFEPEKLHAWLDYVRSTCEKSGHLEVAMLKFGEVLAHSPKDTDGFWIHRQIAEVLNREDSGTIRRGYTTGRFNLRGAHFVDPSGKEEHDLAAEMRRQADLVEDEGFHLFADALRSLAQTYDQDAEWIAERLADGNPAKG